MTAEPSFLGGWDRILLSSVAASLVTFVLIWLKEWLTRRKKHDAFWHAINAELMSASELVGTFINDNVAAPLYRLPRSVFDTCYLQLLADGAISPDEIKALTAYFNEIETLNRGLDLAASTSDDGERNKQHHHRNRVKAGRLKSSGELYKNAAAAIAKHIS